MVDFSRASRVLTVWTVPQKRGLFSDESVNTDTTWGVVLLKVLFLKAVWYPVGKGENRWTDMSINKTRSVLYRIARILGDVQAVTKGRVGRRVARRMTGRAASRFLRNLFK